MYQTIYKHGQLIYVSEAYIYYSAHIIEPPWETGGVASSIPPFIQAGDTIGPRPDAKRGIFAIVAAAAVIASLILFTGSGQYVPRTSDYSTYEIAVQPPSEDYYYPLANYSLVRSGDSIGLFGRVGLANFESGIEFYEGVTNITHTDAYGRLDIHETPTTVVEYKAFGENSMKFELSPGTGAIKKGGAIVVGSEEASGAFVMLDGCSGVISGQNVVFSLPADSSVIFRAERAQDNTVGSAVADGAVAAEMYLTDAGWTIGEDVVSYGTAELYTVTASEEVVEVQVVGESAGKSVVIHVSGDYLDYGSADELTLQLDGVKVTRGAGMAETLWGTGDEPLYYAVESGDGYDVMLYLPQMSDDVVTISGPQADLGVDGLVTLLAAIGIVAVAVVALIKTE